MVNQWERFSTVSKIPHYQAVKRILKYLKGTATQGLIMNPDPEKRIKLYINADVAGVLNQEESTDPGLVLSRTGYLITYANFQIIWASRIQTKISLITMEAEYIALSQAIRYVLPFVSIMKEIEFIIQSYIMKTINGQLHSRFLRKYDLV